MRGTFYKTICTINKTNVSQHEYMDFNTIKILKYARNHVVLFNIFLYFDPRYKCVVSLLPVPGLVDGAPQSRAGAELVIVSAVGALQVTAGPLKTAPGTGAGGSASPIVSWYWN